ncbi:MAG: glycosyltransferase family 4 protein [Candidatus Bathyarchaeia archaeon]
MSNERSVLIISGLDCWSMGEGRGGPALYKTLTGYAQRGWKVYFITGNRAADGASDRIHENIQITRFDAPWLKRLIRVRKIGFFTKILWWLYFQVMAFIKAQRLHAHKKFDVIYGYEIEGVPVAKLLSKMWNVPMVARFQGTSFGVDWAGRKFRYIRAWEHYIGLRIPADLIIMTNDGTRGNKVLEELGVDMTKVRFWMNGIDLELFHNMPKPSEARHAMNLDNKHVLLCVSRLASWKRVDRSICALPDVIKDYPDTVLVIVGDGPERTRLEQMAKRLGVEEHIRFEGAAPHKQIPKYLAAADIFLSFYDWSNVGNPLLEAMIAGRCIVTLNNGDTGQFVKNMENGILLEYEDLPRLPEVIKGLLADEDLRKRLGANARRFAEENFWSWDERINAEIAEVERLIEKQNRKI